LSARDIPPWQARLALGFASNDGRSVLARREQYGPLALQKTLYPEGDAVCHGVLLHPPGGIAGGDTLDIALTLDRGSHALITTPGAAKWYRSLGASATQQVRCQLAAHAALEYLPQETILFDGCCGDSRLDIDMEEGAIFIGWDISVMGRAASGEAYRTGIFRQQTRVSVGGRLCFDERARLAGGDALLDSPAGYRGQRVVGTLLAVGKKVSAGSLASCRKLVMPGSALVGATQLPEVFVARYLGDDAEAARHYFAQIWACLRPELLGRDATPPRIWST
jgi:Urease accessory protein UreH